MRSPAQAGDLFKVLPDFFHALLSPPGNRGLLSALYRLVSHVPRCTMPPCKKGMLVLRKENNIVLSPLEILRNELVYRRIEQGGRGTS